MRASSAATFLLILAPAVVAFNAIHPASPTDACSLLTSAEIEKAMGVPMGPAKSMASKACQWRQPVKQGDAGAIVDVTILDLRRYNIGKAVAGSNKFKVVTVPGLGDEAYYSESIDGKQTDLRAKKGDAAFAVHVWGAGVPIPQLEPKELALAKIIITKF